MSETKTRPAPFDSELWQGWVVRGRYAIKGSLTVSDDGELWGSINYIGNFPSPEAARQVAEAIECAKAGKQVGPVDELVEALQKFTYLANYAQEELNWHTNHEFQSVVQKTTDLLAKYEVQP